MSTTSKSPRRVALEALAVAREALPPYSHPCSPRTYTQHQHFACLVLMRFFKTDHRGIVAMLDDWPSLVEALELDEIMHYSALFKAEQRILKQANVRLLLDATVRRARPVPRGRPRIPLAAIDGTGFESRHVSRYYTKRRESCGQRVSYSRYPTAGILADCRNHLILAVCPSRGPGPDIKHFRKTLADAERRANIRTLLADAGYDSEASHVFARDMHDCRTVIPPLIGRSSRKLPAGRWRRVMATRFDYEIYGQRWQCETVNSMLKRRQGSALRTRTYWAQCREINLRALTHNVMILALCYLFNRAGQKPFLSPLIPSAAHLCPEPVRLYRPA